MHSRYAVSNTDNHCTSTEKEYKKLDILEYTQTSTPTGHIGGLRGEKGTQRRYTGRVGFLSTAAVVGESSQHLSGGKEHCYALREVTAAFNGGGSVIIRSMYA